MRNWCALVLTLSAAATQAAGSARATFEYTLSDSNGGLSLGWASLTWDPAHRELYALSGGVVHVFSETGMEVFSFDDLAGYGAPVSLALHGESELLVLARSGDRRSSIVRCSYRGEPLAQLEPAAFPASVAPFSADSIFEAAGHIYLADRSALKVVVLSTDGAFQSVLDLRRILQTNEASAKSPDDIRGLSVDAAGEVIFTVPTLFAAFIVAPDGTLRSFGQKGSLPGKFNIAAGIAADAEGNLYVADTLRAVVMVFDKDLRFQGEFGKYGRGPSNLVAPASIAVGNGHVYVAQSTGPVKVFALQLE